MNILLTTHQLADFAGSEIYTFELAKGLTLAGHKVTVYSRYIDKFEKLFADAGIPLVTDLQRIQHKHFDVAHVHHHINALEVRLAFPSLPIFFLSHGAKTFLEQPPAIDINIAHYGAVSRRVQQVLTQSGVKKKNISIIPNIVDEQVFSPTTPIRQTIQKALIISNRMDEKTEQVIRSACKKLNIEVTAIGSRFKRVANADIPQYINAADIVFTIGRGVIETMMCGRVPFIYDFKGGDGLLTPDLFKHSAKYHFNGGYKKATFTVAQMVKEVKKYDASYGEKLRTVAMSEYSVKAGVRQLEEVYKKTIRSHHSMKINKELLQYIVETIRVTRLHTFSRSEKKTVVEQLRTLKGDVKALITDQIDELFNNDSMFRRRPLSSRSN